MADKMISFLILCFCFGFAEGANETCTSHCDECAPLGLMCTECGPGRYMADDRESCSSCPRGCKTCTKTGDSAVCDECYDVNNGLSYIMNLLDKECVACPDNCEKCTLSSTGTTACSSCFEGFTVGQDNMCVACPGNCNQCFGTESGDVKCSTCADGYFAAFDGFVCEVCPQNCLRCTSEVLCSKCQVGYLLNENGLCEVCPWQCDECKHTEDITNDDNPINPNVDDTTKKCKDEGCAYGYGYHWHDTCEKCPDYCTACDKWGACSNCLDGTGISLRDPDIPVCEVCPNNCENCFWLETINGMFCSQCADLYALDPVTGECAACDSNCHGSCKWYGTYAYIYQGEDHVVTVNGPVCENCKIRFGLTEDGTCKSCPAGCNTCYVNFMNRGISDEYADWLECAGGQEKCLYHVECDGDLHCYYRNSIDFDPRPIADQMATIYTGSARKRRDVNTPHRTKRAMFDFLTQAEFDSSNIAGYPWIEHSCCRYGYGSVSKAETYTGGGSFNIQVCQACEIDNCNNCDGDISSCNQCDKGFAWSSDDNECKVCEVNGCLNCDTDVTECDECDPYVRYDNHFVEVLNLDTKCLVCPRNCEASVEYLKDPVNTAKRCAYNTDHDRTECGSTAYCLPGTSLTISGLCAYCGQNCEVCIWVYDDSLGYRSEVPRCQTCFAGFAVDEVNDCRVCPENCDVCSWNSAENRMDCGEGQCSEGYANHPTTGGCIFCGAGCLECLVSADTLERTCISQCITGYTSVTGIDSITTCVACPLFCTECNYNAAENRIECLSNDACDDGYTKAFDGTCTACQANTKSCLLLDDSTLQVDQCVEKYFRNKEQCGICPDGCSNCVDVEGVMECTHCKDAFTFEDETKSCLACPENCAECLLDADGQPTCQRCLEEKVMIVPGKCASCDTLAARNCIRCTAPTTHNPSLCLECKEGYALAEDLRACLPCATLQGCTTCVDRGEKCSTCQAGYNRNIDGSCSFECYSCHGDDCGKSANSSGSSGGTIGSVSCDLGACWSYRFEAISDKTVKYFRSCEANMCTEQTEICKETVVNKTQFNVCASCCMGHKCNFDDLTANAARTTGTYFFIFAFIFHCVYF